MDYQEKKKSVANMFSSESEIRFYKEQARYGLFPQEKILFNKYLAVRGTVLDIGCGAGREAIALAKQGHKVTAIDVSDKMITESKKLAAKTEMEIEFMTGDIELLPLRPNSFDYAVMLAQMIEHIPSRKNRIGLLKKIHTCLKPEGVLIFTTHNRYRNFLFWGYWHMTWLSDFLKGTKSELGDTLLAKTNPGVKQNKQKMFFHVYSIKEALADIEASSFQLIDVKSDKELVADKNTVIKNVLHYFYICSKNSRTK
ncbi:class I SAM-dependent methyltransferase [Candidatus Woesearchaeota archaeon]|nr:class I SAM-dependent methyltransferase [Candidatus Woesearchaeota archaeon]